MGVFSRLVRLFNKTEEEPDDFDDDAESITSKPETGKQKAAGNDTKEIDLDDIIAMGPKKDRPNRHEAKPAVGHEAAFTSSDFILFETIMDNLADYIYFKDRNSRFVMVNKAYAQKVFSLSDAHKAVGRTDFDFFPREHAAFFYENEQKIISTGEPLLGKEIKHAWPDGHFTWLMANI